MHGTVGFDYEQTVRVHSIFIHFSHLYISMNTIIINLSVQKRSASRESTNSERERESTKVNGTHKIQIIASNKCTKSFYKCSGLASMQPI